MGRRMAHQYSLAIIKPPHGQSLEVSHVKSSGPGTLCLARRTSQTATLHPQGQAT